MNTSLFKRPITLVWIIGILLAAGFVQAEPPGPPPIIEVFVSVDKPVTQQPYLPNEPIMVTLSLANDGVDEFVRKGWRNLEFWLLLQFYDEKGRLITSDEILESTTMAPPPPRVFPDENGLLIQGTLVEFVEGPDPLQNIDGWSASFTFNAYDYYPLEGRSGLIRFKAVVPVITFQADKIEQTPSGIKYAPRYPIDTTKWYGDVQSGFSSFTLVGDFDGDGYYYPIALPNTSTPVDCNDNNAAVNPGAAEIPDNAIDEDCDGIAQVTEAAAGSIVVNFERYILPADVSADNPNKVPCASSKVAAFDINSECVSNLGFSWKNYEQIMTQCGPAALVGTNAAGECVLNTPPGSYYIIGEYDSGGSKHYCGVSAGYVDANTTVQKYLNFLVKAGGEIMPGAYHHIEGSRLLIIRPEYVKWEDDSNGYRELYPFVFDAEGIWGVTTDIKPPKGFKVVGDDSLTVDMENDIKAIQFTIEKTKGKTQWVPTHAKYTIVHNNKTTKRGTIIHVVLDK